jgi:two-component system, chemotaxis family, CheB/CheR fusion protein
MYMKMDAPLFYVGIGASAGGLEALERFFVDMPPQNEMAFIVIQHLSPDYKSLMVELLSKRTAMEVHRAEDGLAVAKNAIYLIPPRKNLRIFHGKLLLSEQDPAQTRGLNLPIDIFFRSLADDQAEKAVGVILSGTGSDGMRGIRAIKEAGGMVMVQTEDSAKFDGMPRSAISTGLADFILSPDEMPQQLISFSKHPYFTKPKPSERLLTNEEGLNRIFSLLREKHKVDFTHYKPSTVLRRIERRMTIHQIEDLQHFVELLENHEQEVSNLYRDLLIGVTNFFRDNEAFTFIQEKILPQLFKRKENRELRFWVAGCSTGEEAYSLAMICQECMQALDKKFNVKIFATDIDQDALLKAGSGVFPESITADLSSHYLSKYFYWQGDNYHIVRSIREMVVFAQHNITKDPPFTNIDLISCRNLLIYLQPVLQNKVLDLFSFSLISEGILFLGTSETTGNFSDSFDLIHAKWKLYRYKGSRRVIPNISEITSRHDGRKRFVFMQNRESVRFTAQQDAEKLQERLLSTISEEYMPLTLVINEHLELLYHVGDSAPFFRIPVGKMNNDITKMATKELSIPLATGIPKAIDEMKEVRYSNIRTTTTTGEPCKIHLKIVPLPQKKGQDPLVALFIETSEQPVATEVDDSITYDVGKDAQQRIQDLEQELQFNKENLQATIEELETSNEELQATNEELLASNEELQSTNEELQSVNEELYTVNAEYQSKIIELTELNNDVENFLVSTQIGFLLLDENLDIRKFSKKVMSIFRLSDSDVGHSIFRIPHNVKNQDIYEIIRENMNSDESVENEIETHSGEWHLLKISPYAIRPNTFSGKVVTFVNITAGKKIREELHSNEQRWKDMLHTLACPIVLLDTEGEILFTNTAWDTIATDKNSKLSFAGQNYIKVMKSRFQMSDSQGDSVTHALKQAVNGQETRISETIECVFQEEPQSVCVHIDALLHQDPMQILVTHERVPGK